MNIYYCISHLSFTLTSYPSLLLSILKRFCLKDGYYTLVLNDTALYSSRMKHAKVVFTTDTANATLLGTTVVYDFPVGNANKALSDDDDGSNAITSSLGFIVGMTIAGIVIIAVAACWW